MSTLRSRLSMTRDDGLRRSIERSKKLFAKAQAGATPRRKMGFVVSFLSTRLLQRLLGERSTTAPMVLKAGSIRVPDGPTSPQHRVLATLRSAA